MATDQVFAKPYAPFDGFFSQVLPNSPRDVRFAAYAVVGLVARLQAGTPLTTLDQLLLQALRSPSDLEGRVEQFLASFAMSFYAQPDWNDVEDVAASISPEFNAAPPRNNPLRRDAPLRFRLPVTADPTESLTGRVRSGTELERRALEATPRPELEDQPILRAEDRPIIDGADVIAERGPSPGDRVPPARGSSTPGETIKVTTPNITFEKTEGKETITLTGVQPEERPYSEEDGEGVVKYAIVCHAITCLEELSLGTDTIRWTFDGTVTYVDERQSVVALVSGEHKGLEDIRQISDLSDYSFEDPGEHVATLGEMRLANVITLRGGNVIKFGWFQLDDFLSLQGKFTVLETSGANLKEIIDDVFMTFQIGADVGAPIAQAISSSGAALILNAVKENKSFIALGKIISGLIKASEILFKTQLNIDRAAIKRAFELDAVQLQPDADRDNKRIFKASDVPAGGVFAPNTPLTTVRDAVKVIDAGIYNALGIGNPIEYRVTWLARDGGGFGTFEQRFDYLVAIRYERVVEPPSP